MYGEKTYFDGNLLMGDYLDQTLISRRDRVDLKAFGPENGDLRDGMSRDSMGVKK